MHPPPPIVRNLHPFSSKPMTFFLPVANPDDFDGLFAFDPDLCRASNAFFASPIDLVEVQKVIGAQSFCSGEISVKLR